jgi:hypothetical protein
MSITGRRSRTCAGLVEAEIEIDSWPDRANSFTPRKGKCDISISKYVLAVDLSQATVQTFVRRVTMF